MLVTCGLPDPDLFAEYLGCESQGMPLPYMGQHIGLQELTGITSDCNAGVLILSNSALKLKGRHVPNECQQSIGHSVVSISRPELCGYTGSAHVSDIGVIAITS
ncbi:hypothetical protein P7K49_031202 [Saguinus oedipus]|uniref:Uncharacterized protein n=1 Tax=Saguinus oedipus TaxID=9490 RepID=A0ABQ9U4C5_SAGOE|nr:hypothetical protein P7K49_031202 [Saguinus oedipus]